MDQVSAGGFRWRDPSFQKHAHRQVSSILESLQTLSDLASAHKNLENTPLLEFSVKVLTLLTYYERRKLKIPHDSLWFEQKHEHRTWYMTEDTTTGMAHRTGTTLSPNKSVEYAWVEKRLEQILVKCFEINIHRGSTDNVGELFAGIEKYLDALSKNGDTQRADELVGKLCELWETFQSDARAKNKYLDETAEEVGIVDALGTLRIRIMLSYRSMLEDMKSDKTLKLLGSLDWRDEKSLYTNGFGAGEIRQLEWLLPRMQMELAIEGAIKTAPWYVHDLILKVRMEKMLEDVDRILSGGFAFKYWYEKTISAGRIWQTAAILARQLEYINKLDVHLGFFGRTYESLSAARHLSDLQWPEIDKQKWVDLSRKLRIELGRSMAQHVAILSMVKNRRSDVPDYLGQFVDETGENLFDVLLNNEVKEIASLFPQYLIATLGLFDRMRPENPKLDIWTEQKTQTAAAPVLDLLELSGYAKVFAELYGEPMLWTSIVEPWDRLLDSTPQMLSALSAIATIGIPRFQIPHRGLRRGEWSTRVRYELDKVEKTSRAHGGRGFSPYYTSEEIVHPSALIRYCAKHNFYSGWEIFASLYLSQKTGGKTLQWGRSVNDLSKSLKREEESYREGDEAGSE